MIILFMLRPLITFALDLPIFPLSEIKPKNAQVIRSKPFHKVYQDNNKGIVYKIWKKNYIDSRYFKKALELDFYRDFTPLIGLITDDKGVCKGYITYLCQKITNKDLKLERVFSTGKERRIANVGQQPLSYQKLYYGLLEAAQRTSLFFMDLTPYNLVKDGEKILLIDLESVRYLSELNNSPLDEVHKKHLPQDYLKAIKKIAAEKKKKMKNLRNS